MNQGGIPEAHRAAIIEPAEGPTTKSAEAGSQPVSSARASSPPVSQAPPWIPPAPRTSPTLIRHTLVALLTQTLATRADSTCKLSEMHPPEIRAEALALVE